MTNHSIYMLKHKANVQISASGLNELYRQLSQTMNSGGEKRRLLFLFSNCWDQVKNINIFGLSVKKQVPGELSPH